jgi:hypothetical protein
VLPRLPAIHRPVTQSDTIRLELAFDGVDRVEHRDVRHREKAGRQDPVGCRNRVLQNLVPLEHDIGGRPGGAHLVPGRRQQGEKQCGSNQLNFIHDVLLT